MSLEIDKFRACELISGDRFSMNGNAHVVVKLDANFIYYRRIKNSSDHKDIIRTMGRKSQQWLERVPPDQHYRF